MFRTTETGAATPEYRRPTEPPRPMPDIANINIEAMSRELHDAAHRGIRTPEDFQTRYMGKWNVYSVPIRPCTVDGQPALFHRFVENDRGILKINAMVREDTARKMIEEFNENNVIPSACTLEKLRSTMALIEWPDGRLSTVAVERVQFADRGNGGENG